MSTHLQCQALPHAPPLPNSSSGSSQACDATNGKKILNMSCSVGNMCIHDMPKVVEEIPKSVTRTIVVYMAFD